jgi:uncharacterized membrane protein YkvA (DUF1232 family)
MNVRSVIPGAAMRPTSRCVANGFTCTAPWINTAKPSNPTWSRTRDITAAKAFFRRALRRHGDPRVITLDGFEPTHAALRRMGLDATAFHYALRSLNGRLLEKLESINSDEYPGLREAVQVIIQVFESPEAWQAKDPLPRWLAEVAFGARYLLKRFDFIADHLPGIGLADDARLLERILERNQLELRRYLGKPSAVAATQNR